MQTRRHSGRASERGVALIMVVLSTILLASLAMGLVYMATTDISVNANYRDSQVAYFAARAGIEEARQRLAPDLNGDGAAWAITGPTAAPTGGGANILYILNPRGGEAVQPFTDGTPYSDLQLCWERFNSLALPVPGEQGLPCARPPAAGAPVTFPSISPRTGEAGALAYKWVRITTKRNRASEPYCPSVDCALDSTDRPICWDGAQQRVMPASQTACELQADGQRAMLNTVWRVTSLAVTPTGARRLLQAEVANTPPFAVNGSVQSKDHVTLHGNLVLNSLDHCSCDCTFDAKGVVVKNADGSPKCVNRPGKVCDLSRWAVYSASQVTTKGTQYVSSAKNPPFAQDMPWDVNVDELVSKLRRLPDTVDVRNDPYNYACAGTPSDCGTRSTQVFGIPPKLPPYPVDAPAANSALGPPTRQITYVPGSVKLTSGSIGNGILVVDGDLEIQGGLEFYGLILVNGTVKFSGGGSAKTNIFGAILAATKSIDAIEVEGEDYFGGSFAITYDYCALKPKYSEAPPDLLAIRELAY